MPPSKRTDDADSLDESFAPAASAQSVFRAARIGASALFPPFPATLAEQEDGIARWEHDPLAQHMQLRHDALAQREKEATLTRSEREELLGLGEQSFRRFLELIAPAAEMEPVSPEQLARSQVTSAALAFWRAWFPSRCLDVVYRKLLHYIATEQGQVEQPPDVLTPAALVVPAALTLSWADGADADAVVREFVDHLKTDAPKLIAYPLYDDPQPSDWQFQGELWTTVTATPVAAEPLSQLALFLVPSARGGPKPGRFVPLGLLLPPNVRWLGDGCKVVPISAPAEQGEVAKLGPARLLASTLPYWVDSLGEHIPSLLHSEGPPPPLFHLPAPPRPDLAAGRASPRRIVAQHWIIPQVFSLIQHTISPQDPDAVACHISSPSPDAATLYTLASSDNYPRFQVPDIRIVAGGGLNWGGPNGMGLSGRAAITGRQRVARYGGADISDDVRDPRVLYGDTEQVLEALATPILGGSEKSKGLGVADDSVWQTLLGGKPHSSRTAPGHLYAILYVFTKQRALTRRGILRPDHVLWLRELAALLSEYFGFASASSRRDRRIGADHEIGYLDILADADSEREELLAPLLGFVHRQVRQASGDAAEQERLTFVSFGIAAHETLASRTQDQKPAESVLVNLRDYVRSCCKEDLAPLLAGGDAISEPVFHRGRVLMALRLSVESSFADALGAVYSFIENCRGDWPSPQPSLNAFVFQRGLRQLARLGFKNRSTTQQFMALRRLDPTFRLFRAYDYEVIADALGANNGATAAIQPVMVGFPSPSNRSLEWLRCSEEDESAPTSGHRLRPSLNDTDLPGPDAAPDRAATSQQPPLADPSEPLATARTFSRS